MDGQLDGKAARVVEQVRAAQLPEPEERRRIRLRAGLTYRDLGDALEVDTMTAWRWENGRTAPRRAAAVRYRRLLDALVEAVG